MAYFSVAGEKEYYLSSACEKVYAPPSATVSLRGLAVTGTRTLLFSITVCGHEGGWNEGTICIFGGLDMWPAVRA